MRLRPNLRRALLAGFVAVAFVALVILGGPSGDSAPAPNLAPAPVASQWGGGPGRNLVNLLDKKVPTDWDTKKGKERNVKWSVDLGSKAYGGPMVVDGRLFIGTNNNRPRDPKVVGDKGIVMCFDAATGTFLWQYVSDKLPIGRAQDWPEEGICSVPAVKGDRLWFVNNRCEVVCAAVGGDPKRKGKALVHWKLDMIGKLGVVPHDLAVCSPLLVGNTLFVVTGNGVDQTHVNIPAPNAPSFLALDKNTGRVLWQSNLPGVKIMHGQWSNPTFAFTRGTQQVIFPGGDGWLYAFAPRDGTLLWKFDCNPKGGIWKLGPAGTKNYFIATPVVWQDKLYIGVGQDPEHSKGVGHLWCIDLVKALEKGQTNPKKDVSPRGDNFDPRAAINRNSALKWHYGGFDDDPNADRPYFFGRTLSTCAVHEGLCYVADYDGYFYCFDALTGKKLWEHEFGADTWSSPYWVAGHVYIGNERGQMHIFKHGRLKELVRVVRTPSPATKIRSTPVAANGILYLVTENPCRLWAIR